jgi:hypothetical protein
MAKPLLRQLVVYLCLYVGYNSQNALGAVTTASDLISQVQSERGIKSEWRVDFNFKALFSLSNSIVIKLKAPSGDTNRLKNLRSQLERITRGEIPSQTTEIRTGSVTFADSRIRVDDDLVSIVPLRQDVASVSNRTIVITKETYTKLYSYIGKSGASILGEAEMRPLESNTTGFPLPLITAELIRFMSSLTNISIDQDMVEGIHCYRLKGNVTTGCMGDCEIDFDPQKQMFPFRITLSQCDGMFGEYRVIGANEDGFGWMPVRAELSFKNADTEIYGQTWEFSNYRVEKSIKESEFQFEVPGNYVVNEYRYSLPFAYIMGVRPPTKEELQKMSTNREAILKYQIESRNMAAAIPQINQKQRNVVRTAFLAIAIGGLILVIFLYTKGQRAGV